jgi:hypothetical protein
MALPGGAEESGCGAVDIDITGDVVSRFLWNTDGKNKDLSSGNAHNIGRGDTVTSSLCLCPVRIQQEK